MTPSPKTALRRCLRSARRALTPAEHLASSLRAARTLAKLPSFGRGRRIAIYLSFDGEVDTAPLLRAARARSITVYLPVIVDKRRGRMRFHRFEGRVAGGHFGIGVPRRLGPPLAARWLDLVVVPLVGIDGEGFRLGMGRGFYDRALSYRRTGTRLGPRLVGLAFECQRTDDVHAEAWDIRLDALVTENGLYRFTSR